MDIDERTAAADLAARVVELGRRGLSRAEIGPALGLELAELAALEAGDADFARAMRRAGEAERGWWEAQPREALAAGARLNIGAWQGAMRWRFGAAEGAKAAEAAKPAAPARPRARYYIPDNLRDVRLADGTLLTPELRRERAIAQAQEFLESAERDAASAREDLAEAEEELARWQEEMRHVEARNYDPAAEDDEEGDDEDWDEDDWDEDGDDDDRDWDEEDEIDDADGDDGDGDGDGADEGRGDDGVDGDGGGGAGGPLPLAPGGELASPSLHGGRRWRRRCGRAGFRRRRGMRTGGSCRGRRAASLGSAT